jgi:hypothetical protein
MSVIFQQDVTMYSLLYFCKLLHPSSGAHITVTTASGTGQTSENAVCEVS